jgi:hypothetical protein
MILYIVINCLVIAYMLLIDDFSDRYPNAKWRWAANSSLFTGFVFTVINFVPRSLSYGTAHTEADAFQMMTCISVGLTILVWGATLCV